MRLGHLRKRTIPGSAPATFMLQLFYDKNYHVSVKKKQ